MNIGLAQALVGRVSFTGDLGYEIWMKPEYQRYILNLLLETGEQFGIKLFGLRALNSLRLEKNYGSWARDYRPVYNPYECELGRFVALDKQSDFIGKQAAAQSLAAGGGPMRLRGFVVEAIDADVIGDEPIFLNGEVFGWVTSGGYAHNSNVSYAVGYVPKELAEQENGWEIEVLGKRLVATMQKHPLFDANGERMRS